MNSRRTSAFKAPAALSPEALLKLDNQLCFALYSTSLAMTKLYKPLLDQLGLTYPQYLAMLALWEQDGVTVGELGARLCLDSGTLTPLLKRLEAGGWIARTRAADDERRVLVTLTPEGRGRRKQAVAIPKQLASAIACSAQELGELRQRLHELRQRLVAQISPTNP